ncbi:MAG: acyl-ACP--UDP-N-acetylglucosamine O-acyltransferase [Alphaproteobacteria bacterium]|nr:acyl-ACP--UDP-N-acetylglucosamine O-acyltransferase [Alphaproteobacteria bacterium]MBU1279625.1 acyl-ACP--UDP-N-acetylglucosamine O-acyltransferase [Alphaproteobacteria bacterium]MBU1574505.1 acyl-ACP--UDP-N-acetylglucosamine O-acyltransferase [Alphaproteobacteria bacterium]MBU1827557.1 acyl-ACP--UDP-N-acetylglucosamine O-acyltransferase [Alphaproteobacteria bacterium]MBU2078322.1 acyl-ACP--UDP-N-acetylglucosamine O-acyltransferase [Alphaproteobacteria bacterium]
MSLIDPSAKIHPSSVIEEGAVIGAGCDIGPFCMIGPKVRLGAGVVIKSHVVIEGMTEIGDETTVFQFASIGAIPQDLKFKGEETRLVIGKRNRIREYVTMNLGTEGGGGVTRVGDDGLFMACAHVAHDAQIGDRVILVNSVAVAGHCVIDDDVIVGGLSGIHQWVRIGQGAIIGALSMVTADVLPHALVQGPRAELDGLNLVGLKRKGVARDDINQLRAAFQMLKQGEGAFKDRAQRLSEDFDSDYVARMVAFVMGDSDRGFLTPK